MGSHSRVLPPPWRLTLASLPRPGLVTPTGRLSRKLAHEVSCWFLAHSAHKLQGIPPRPPSRVNLTDLDTGVLQSPRQSPLQQVGPNAISRAQSISCCKMWTLMLRLAATDSKRAMPCCLQAGHGHEGQDSQPVEKAGLLHCRPAWQSTRRSWSIVAMIPAQCWGQACTSDALRAG